MRDYRNRVVHSYERPTSEHVSFTLADEYSAEVLVKIDGDRVRAIALSARSYFARVAEAIQLAMTYEAEDHRIYRAVIAENAAGTV